MYYAMIMAPIVSASVPFILGFFFVLGMMAQDKPRHKQVVSEHKLNPNVISNEEIIRRHKGE